METKARYGARLHRRLAGNDVDWLLAELVVEQACLTDQLGYARELLGEPMPDGADPADVVVAAHLRLSEIERTSRAIIASLREAAIVAAESSQVA
jgi:hypothetical protein